MTEDRAELERLKAELESYRQRELAELRSALAEAKQLVSFYRQEAERNAMLGRQIASEYQTQLAALRAELQAMKAGITYAQRFGTGTAGGTRSN